MYYRNYLIRWNWGLQAMHHLNETVQKKYLFEVVIRDKTSSRFE